MRNIKEINIINRMTNIKNFEFNLLKIDKKSYKNIDIYYIGYTTINDIGDYR